MTTRDVQSVARGAGTPARAQPATRKGAGLFWVVVVSLISATALLTLSALLGAPVEGSEPPTIGDYLLIKKFPDQQTVQRGSNARFTIIVSNFDPDVDLTDVTVQDIVAPDCNRVIGDLPANSNFPTYTCFLNDVQEPVVNWATAKGLNPLDGMTDQARDSAAVDIIDIAIATEAAPVRIASPGGAVDFSVAIQNSGSVTVLLRSLTSPQLGNLVDPGNVLLSDNVCSQTLRSLASIPSGGSVSCTFRSQINGETGSYPIEIAAVAVDNAGNEVSKADQLTIEMKPAVRYDTFLPVSVVKVDEPNNRCQDAYPIETDEVNYFFPDDANDWYYFDLDQAAEVLVELSNFVPRLGQIVIYKGTACSSLAIVKNNGNDLESKPVPLGRQPAGRYYVLVVNAGEASRRVPYELTVNIQ